MQNALIVTASVIVGIFILGLFGFLFYGVYRMYKQLEKLNESIQTVPQLLDGIIRLCGDLVQSSTKMSTSVTKFQSQIFEQDKTGKRPSAFMEYDEGVADAAWKVNELMQRYGISQQEARDRLMAGDEERFVVHE